MAIKPLPLLPPLLPLSFTVGPLVLFGLSAVLSLGYLAPDLLDRFRPGAST